jgi:hypothetical protein
MIPRSTPYPPGYDPAAPWLITRSDLQRYTYRAIEAVATAPHRIIFIPMKSLRVHNLRHWVMLCSVRASDANLWRAVTAFRQQRVARIRLADLPALRRKN